MALFHRLLVEALDAAADRQMHTHPLGQLAHQGDVLADHGQAVGAVIERHAAVELGPDQHLHDPRRRQAGVHHLQQALRLDADRPTQGDRLHDARQRGDQDQVLAQLGGLAAAGRSQVKDVLAHQRQQRLHTPEQRRLATDHDAECRRLRPGPGATERRVQKADVMACRVLLQLAGQLRADGAAVDDHAAGRHAGDERIHRGADHFLARQAGEHDLRALPDGGGIGAGSQALLGRRGKRRS